jgi:integrase
MECQASRRVIPLNNELFLLLKHHADWFESKFGECPPDYYLFPYGVSQPKDPTRPTLSIKKAWGEMRKRSGVHCRIHDLRHTAITRLAETGVSDATLMAIVGHMSRRMLEHYSHIRMQAKRVAMDALSTPTLKPRQNGVPTILPTLHGISKSHPGVS